MDSTMLKNCQKFDYGNPVPPAGAWLAQQDSPEAAWSLSLAFQPDAVPNTA
jgi:hypothetical protein